MNTVIRVLYTGEDIVIRSDEIRRSGIRPGDYVLVKIEPSTFKEEKTVEEVLKGLWGAWSEEEEETFYREREEMWHTWEPIQ